MNKIIVSLHVLGVSCWELRVRERSRDSGSRQEAWTTAGRPGDDQAWCWHTPSRLHWWNELSSYIAIGNWLDVSYERSMSLWLQSARRALSAARLSSSASSATPVFMPTVTRTRTTKRRSLRELRRRRAAWLRYELLLFPRICSRTRWACTSLAGWKCYV